MSDLAPESDADMTSQYTSRIGLLADIHLDSDNETSVTNAVTKAMNHFKQTNVDSVVVLGDLIMEGENSTESMNRLKKVREYYDMVDVPVYNVAGNHDVIHLSPSVFYDQSLNETLWKVFPISDTITGVLLDTSAAEYPDARGKIGQNAINELQSILEKEEYVVLFSHHPLYYYELDETNWFAEHPEAAFASDKYLVQELLEEHDNVLVGVNGHTHQENHSVYNNTPYFTVNPMTNESPSDTGVNGSFSVLEVSPTQVRMISHKHGAFNDITTVNHPTGNRHVAFGGTFDPIHDGHRQIFQRACEIGDVTVGLTSTELSERTRSSDHDVTQFIQRKKNLYNELQQVASRYNREFTIEELTHPMGIVSESTEITHLVVSPETFSRGEQINAKRLENGLQPLELTVVDPVLASDGKRISSTRLRNGEIDEHGNVIE